MEIAAGLLRHPSSISVDAGWACDYFHYVFKFGSVYDVLQIEATSSMSRFTSGSSASRVAF